MDVYTNINLCKVESEVELREVTLTDKVHISVHLSDMVILQTTQTERYTCADIREDIYCKSRSKSEAETVVVCNARVAPTLQRVRNDPCGR